MKKFLKEKIIEPILKLAASSMLKKHQPEIIGITGSVGKTSIKDAVACVLSKRFSVLSAPRSYNTKIGSPLTIFGENVPVPVTSPLGWLKVIFSCFLKFLVEKDYPKILILEMGIEEPGEMNYYLSFIRPKIGIITAVGEAHLLGLKTKEKVASEKGLLPENLPPSGLAILNYDDPLVRKMAQRTKAKVLTYGFSSSADLWLSDLTSELSGTSFKVHFKEEEVSVLKFPLLGKHSLYSIMPAIICGLIYGMSLKKTIKALADFRLPKGRMNLIAGIKESLIIDDSYNANPTSMISALEVLFAFPNGGRKIAALGTMNELGDFEKEGHRKVGREAFKVADLLITVGVPANRYLASEAKKAGFSPAKIFSFENSYLAGKFLKNKIRKGDVILVKGSQNNVRMEWLIEQIMANPQKAKDLLVRQEKEWTKPPELLLKASSEA